MPDNFVPGRDEALLGMSLNFKTLINDDAALYSLTPAQATTYGTLHDAFASAMALIGSPETRTPTNLEVKRVARRNLVANLRVLAGVVQRAPSTTNEMRIALRITPKDSEPTPVGPPAMKPNVVIKSTVGNTVTFSLENPEDTSRRARPNGVDGATILSFAGDTAPANISEWKLEGQVGRMTNITVTFPSTLVKGTTVWILAYYFNPRKQSGPPSLATPTNLQGGVVSMTA